MSVGTFSWLVLQEVRGLLVARWVGGATLLLCAASAFSVALNIRDLQEQKVLYREMLQQRVEAQLRGTGRPSGRFAEPGLRVIRPPAPGAVLATGIEQALPAAWEFTPAGTEALAPYPRNDTGINNRGVGDLAGIITGLGGLLALWLGVSIVVSDTVTGRISALRSLPVAAEAMSVIRLAGGGLVLIVVAVVWSLTVRLSLRMFVPVDVEIPSLMPVWMAVSVACYLMLMFALGTASGAVAKEGLTALVTAFLIWMAIVFVMPQTSQLITRSAIGVPPQTRMQFERQEHMDDAMRLLEREVGVAMAAQWPDAPIPSLEQQHVAYFAVGEPIWIAGTARIRDAASLEERQWIQQRARADRVSHWLDRLNPRSWLVESMTELAGTGRSTEADWAGAIAAHGRILSEHLFDNRPKVNAPVPWKNVGVLTMAFDRRPPPRFSDLPPLVGPPTHVGVWTAAALRSLAGLVAYTFLAMTAAYFALRSRLR